MGDQAAIIGAVLTNFSVPHMIGAARFSRKVGELENQHHGQGVGDFWDEILSCATASVLLAAAALESYANELFLTGNVKFFAMEMTEEVGEAWQGLERQKGTTFAKFDAAMTLRGHRLDKGGPAYQNARLVFKLRNALMHFKPEWEAVVHKELSDQLRCKFDPSPYLDDKTIFPRRWATYACTKWAVDSAIAFADDFDRQAGYPLNFDRQLYNDKRLVP
jgi:hypothetical protein